MMSVHDKARQSLRFLIALVGLAALIWGAAMLVGGFRAAELLDNQWNPLASALVWFAAVAVMGANALFYYALTARKRRGIVHLLGQIVCVIILTGISTTLQTYVTQRSANGENLLKAKEVTVQAQGTVAGRIDRDMTEEFDARIGVIEQRMRYEEVENGGKGPRYRAARREFNRLSERYAGTLGRLRTLALQRRNVSEDAAAVRSYLAYLAEKARVYVQFAEEVSVLATDYAARIGKIEASLSGIKEDVYIDEKSVIYLSVLNKLQAMVKTNGAADIAFTMAFLVAIAPDIVQLLCALLLYSMRPREEETVEFKEFEGWSPADKVWGESARDTVH